MDTHSIAVFCLCGDMLKALHHHEDLQCRMSDVEVMTCALVAVMYYGGNYAAACKMRKAHGYIPAMLSASRYNRQLQRIQDCFLTLFTGLSDHWKALNVESVYCINSFPIPMCDNIRIPRARLYHDACYRGYCASKKRYFYGLKLQLLITHDGHPVEVFLTPGATADVSALTDYAFDLPPESIVYADRGYNDYALEDELQETADISLLPMRKQNSKRPLPAWQRYLQLRWGQ
ncbi:MAG: IS982 family transposase [Anaerolineae bacterium]|nr:IS982 family transposase [Anaerolineae bacterium]